MNVFGARAGGYPTIYMTRQNRPLMSVRFLPVGDFNFACALIARDRKRKHQQESSDNVRVIRCDVAGMSLRRGNS